jgi:hypothetical protein
MPLAVNITGLAASPQYHYEPVEPRMQLSHSQKHQRVVDGLISCNMVPRKGFPDLARLRVAVEAVQRS